MTTTIDTTDAGAFGRPRLAANRAPASYERISKFRVRVGMDETEVTRGVVRQRITNVKAAADGNLGVIPADLMFRDENRSASRFAKRQREDFETLLDTIRARRVSVVLIWLLDRVVRTTEDLDRLLAACRATDTMILATATGSWIDASNPESVMAAKMAGVVAEYETAKMSLRLAAMHKAKAERGLFTGGRRAFGYNASRTEIVETEAAIVRELAGRIVRGESLSKLARELKERGVTTQSGGWFSPGNLGNMFRKGAHLAGYRPRDGKVQYDADGAPVMGSWPPILTVDEWDAVRSVLNDPSRKTNKVGTARRHLLSSVATCGVCGDGLAAKQQGGNGGKAYYCRRGHVARRMSDVDSRVADLVAGYVYANVIDIRTPRDAGGADWDTRAERIRQRLDKALDDHFAGRYSDAEYDRAKSIAQRELAAIDAERRAVAQPAAALDAFKDCDDYDAAREVFRDMPLDVKRVVVKACGVVVVDRAARKGAKFDPLTVRWADPPEATDAT